MPAAGRAEWHGRSAAQAGRFDNAAQFPGGKCLDGLRVASTTDDFQLMVQAHSAMLTVGAA